MYKNQIIRLVIINFMKWCYLMIKAVFTELRSNVDTNIFFYVLIKYLYSILINQNEKLQFWENHTFYKTFKI